MKIRFKVTVDLTMAEKLVWQGVHAGSGTLITLLVTIGLMWICWPHPDDLMGFIKVVRYLCGGFLGLVSLAGLIILVEEVLPWWRTAYWVARHDNGIKQLTLFSYSPSTARFHK